MNDSSQIIKTGGICLILLALLTATVGIINAIAFSYPLQVVLPIHQAISFSFVGNDGLREAMTLGSLLPLFLIPGSLGLYFYLKDKAHGAMLSAHYFAMIAMTAWIFGQMLWPAFNWYISQYQYQESIPAMTLLVISGVNDFLHVYIGEYLRLTALGLWMFLVSISAMRHARLPNWLCWLGMLFAVMLWVVLLARLFTANPILIEHEFNYLPLVNLWIFLVGAMLLVRGNPRMPG